MRRLVYRTIKMFWGIFIVSLGVVFMLNANIGLPPWDVLHSGVSKITGMTIGTSIIVISVILTLIAATLGEKIGIGTVCNVIFVGLFVDIIRFFNIVPEGTDFNNGFILINIGIIILAVGTVIYISSELGCGSKDGLTMALSRKFNKQVKHIRVMLEIGAVVIGAYIGGEFSVVTIYVALCFGYFMQKAFKMFKCNPQKLNHKSIIAIFAENRALSNDK